MTNKGRMLNCRKCEGHGKIIQLKGHTAFCPYNNCECRSCVRLMRMRKRAFYRRYKESIDQNKLDESVIFNRLHQNKFQIVSPETVAIPSASSPRSSSAEVDQPSSSQEAATGAMLFPPEDLTSYMTAMQNNNDLSAFFQHQQQAAAASSIAAAVAACSVQSTSSVAVTSSCAKSQAPPLAMPPGMQKPAGFNLAPINDVDMMKLLQNPNLLSKSLPSGGLPNQVNDQNKPKPKEGNRPTVSPIAPQLMNGISSSPSHMVNGLKRPQPGTGLQSLQEQLVSSMNGPPPAKRHSISAMPTGPSIPQNGLMMSGPPMNPQLAAAVAAQQMSINKMNIPQPGMMGMTGLNAQFMPNQRINGNDGPQPNLLNVPGPAQMNAMNMQQLQQLFFHQQLQQQLQQQQAKHQGQAKLSGTAQHHQTIQQQHANWMQAKFLAEQQHQQQQQQRLAQQQQQQRMNGPSPIMNQMQLLQLMQQQQNQQVQSNPLAANPAFFNAAQQQQLMQLQHQQQIMQLQQQQAQHQQTEQRRRAQTIGNASQLSALHNQTSHIPSITLGQGIPQPLVPQLPTSITPFSSLTPQPHQQAVSPALSNTNNNESAQSFNVVQNGATPIVSSPPGPTDHVLANPPTLQPEQGTANQEAIQKMLASWSSLLDPQVLQQFHQIANAAVNQGNGQPQITVASASDVQSEASTTTLLAPQSSSVDSAAPTTRAGSANPSQTEESEKSEAGLVIAEEEDNPVVD